jgi:aminopeptidase
MSLEDFQATGGNDSLVHVDWMIGSPDMDVDGLSASGEREAVMRGGEFVI